MRRLLVLALTVGCQLSAVGSAWAQPGPVEPLTADLPAETVVEYRAATWPLSLDVHALIGIEPHSRGNPTAFGAGAELLWKAKLGGFAELLSSEGTPVVTPTIGTVKEQSFGDRISVPFGLAVRPLSWWFIDRVDFASRLATGLALQLGITVEHVRTSDDSATTAGLHAALGMDVPFYGGPKRGGIGLRLYARMMVTPPVNLDFDNATHLYTVFHPIFTGQLFMGLVYWP